MLAKSVVGLTAAEIREKAGLGKRRVNVVFGGAPCQGSGRKIRTSFGTTRQGERGIYVVQFGILSEPISKPTIVTSSFTRCR